MPSTAPRWSFEASREPWAVGRETTERGHEMLSTVKIVELTVLSIKYHNA